MSRTVRHLRHGNVTVSINGPTELVDDFRVALTLYDAGGEGTMGEQLAEFARKIDALGGEYTDFRENTEIVWKNSIDAHPLEITVFG